MKRLYTWQGKLYGVLLDADAQILYYRKDVLGNQDYQENFKSKLGYDLPNPPKTMQEMHDRILFYRMGLERRRKGRLGNLTSCEGKPTGVFHFSLFLPLRHFTEKQILLLQPR